MTELGQQLTIDNRHALTMVFYLQAKTMTVGTQITLSQEKALELFCEEAVDLLTDQEDHCISVHKFCGEYHKMFGTQYKLANFGFKKAVDLFKALPGNMIEV